MANKVGRPKTVDGVNLTINLDKTLRDRLSLMAKAQDRSLSWLANKAIEEYLGKKNG